MLSIGAAEIDITPAPGLAMDGYMAREGVSVGAHDPLLAQVLVLADGKERAAIVTLDVLGVSAAFADSLRASIAKSLNTDVNRVMVCASHTHCGPSGLRWWFGAPPSLDETLTRDIEARVGEAAQAAVNRLSPARLMRAAGEFDGVGSDRNRRDGIIDSRLTALRFDNANDGTPMLVLFHYACHPTVLGADTLHYSADFPGTARNTIAAAYPQAVCMYLNGAAGNISTRFTRREQSFAEVQRLGALLGHQVIALLQTADEVDLTAPTSVIASKHRTIELPLRAFDDTPARSLAPSGNQRIDQTRAEGATIETRLREAFAGRTFQPATLHTLRIGSLALAFVPGEAFSDLALAVHKVSPNALVAGYANDYIGYFPTQRAINEQTYEALSSPYDARAHQLIETTLTEQLRDDVSNRV